MICFMFLPLLLLLGCNDKNDELSYSRIEDGIITVGIYSDNGAAEGCVIAAEKMFQWMNYSTQRITANTINSGSVSNIDIFYFPGGSSGPYRSDINREGRERIKSMVLSGGAYIGTCAGALYACEKQLWEGQVITNGQLGLFSGSGVGPNPEIFAYPKIGMCKINLNKNHPTVKNMPDTCWVMFYNGPYFSIGSNDNSTSGIGYYDKTGRAAIIACNYGKGRVFLTGPHPEWEEDDARDGIPYFKEFDDQGSDWDFMKSAAEWCIAEE